MIGPCQQGTYHHEKQEKAIAEVTAMADSTTFSADITSLNAASRKRVRTADVRCRVRNVFAATAILEQTVNRMNGVIVESSLGNDFGTQTDLAYSADSLRRMQLYTPTANLTLRVPTAQPESFNGDGKKFTSKDGQAEIITFGSLVFEETGTSCGNCWSCL